MGITSKDSSKVGCTIYLLIICLIGYVAYMWGEAQWNYESMKKETSELIKILLQRRTLRLINIRKCLLIKRKELISTFMRRILK